MLQRTLLPQSFMSQCNQFNESKVVGKKWCIRIGCLWSLQAGGQEMVFSENLWATVFYNQRKSGEGEDDRICLSWVGSFSSRLSREFPCPYMVKLALEIIVLYVWRQRVTQIINLLSTLGSLQFSITTALLFGGMSHASTAWRYC